MCLVEVSLIKNWVIQSIRESVAYAAVRPLSNGKGTTLQNSHFFGGIESEKKTFTKVFTQNPKKKWLQRQVLHIGPNKQSRYIDLHQSNRGRVPLSSEQRNIYQRHIQVCFNLYNFFRFFYCDRFLRISRKVL